MQRNELNKNDRTEERDFSGGWVRFKDFPGGWMGQCFVWKWFLLHIEFRKVLSKVTLLLY